MTVIRAYELFVTFVVIKGKGVALALHAIERIYQRLYEFFGAQRWWPGETVEEIIIGAVLTQNTNWENVERAIDNLKEAHALSLKKIATLSAEKLSALIRPSGYFNVKEKRLRAVAEYFVRRCNGDPSRLKGIPTCRLRKELLGVYGVGRETADSILLYALGRRIFVVDAYTMRMGRRHGLLSEKDDYEDARRVFESSLKKSVRLYNEYHALIVRLGKEYCKPHSHCDGCPLNAPEFYIHG